MNLSSGVLSDCPMNKSPQTDNDSRNVSFGVTGAESPFNVIPPSPNAAKNSISTIGSRLDKPASVSQPPKDATVKASRDMDDLLKEVHKTYNETCTELEQLRKRCSRKDKINQEHAWRNSLTLVTGNNGDKTAVCVPVCRLTSKIRDQQKKYEQLLEEHKTLQEECARLKERLEKPCDKCKIVEERVKFQDDVVQRLCQIVGQIKEQSVYCPTETSKNSTAEPTTSRSNLIEATTLSSNQSTSALLTEVSNVPPSLVTSESKTTSSNSLSTSAPSISHNIDAESKMASNITSNAGNIVKVSSGVSESAEKSVSVVKANSLLDDIFNLSSSESERDAKHSQKCFSDEIRMAKIAEAEILSQMLVDLPKCVSKSASDTRITDVGRITVSNVESASNHQAATSISDVADNSFDKTMASPSIISKVPERKKSLKNGISSDNGKNIENLKSKDEESKANQQNKKSSRAVKESKNIAQDNITDIKNNCGNDLISGQSSRNPVKSPKIPRPVWVGDTLADGPTQNITAGRHNMRRKGNQSLFNGESIPYLAVPETMQVDLDIEESADELTEDEDEVLENFKTPQLKRGILLAVEKKTGYCDTGMIEENKKSMEELGSEKNFRNCKVAKSNCSNEETLNADKSNTISSSSNDKHSSSRDETINISLNNKLEQHNASSSKVQASSSTGTSELLLNRSVSPVFNCVLAPVRDYAIEVIDMPILTTCSVRLTTDEINLLERKTLNNDTKSACNDRINVGLDASFIDTSTENPSPSVLGGAFVRGNVAKVEEKLTIFGDDGVWLKRRRKSKPKTIPELFNRISNSPVARAFNKENAVLIKDSSDMPPRKISPREKICTERNQNDTSNDCEWLGAGKQAVKISAYESQSFNRNTQGDLNGTLAPGINLADFNTLPQNNNEGYEDILSLSEEINATRYIPPADVMEKNENPKTEKIDRFKESVESVEKAGYFKSLAAKDGGSFELMFGCNSESQNDFRLAAGVTGKQKVDYKTEKKQKSRDDKYIPNNFDTKGESASERQNSGDKNLISIGMKDEIDAEEILSSPEQEQAEGPDESALLADNSFNRLPSKKPDKDYVYVDVVRKKHLRQKMDAFACQQCEKWYRGMGIGEEELKERLKSCRHKAVKAPTSTPDHYWSVTFPTTQECKDRGYIQSGVLEPSRFRRKRKLCVPEDQSLPPVEKKK